MLQAGRRGREGESNRSMSVGETSRFSTSTSLDKLSLDKRDSVAPTSPNSQMRQFTNNHPRSESLESGSSE